MLKNKDIDKNNNNQYIVALSNRNEEVGDEITLYCDSIYCFSPISAFRCW